MPPPRHVDPLEALRIVTDGPPAGRVRRVPIEKALGLRLARPLEAVASGAGFPDDPADARRASRDGYAVSGPVLPGDELEVVERGSGGPRAAPAPGRAVRVECGETLAREVERVLAVGDATVIGARRIRIERLPEAGREDRGVARSPRRRADLPAGALVTPRTRALIAARGTHEVEVLDRLRVGFLSIGDELTDVHRDLGESARAGDERRDITGAWLGDALALDGAEPVALGIAGDDPAAIRKSLLRARSRKVDVLVVAGGLGDGISDRTVEAIRSVESRVLFERVACDLSPHVLFAKYGGFEVIGIGGLPLSAAAAYDLWVRPALLARQGAAPEAWDWRRRRIDDGPSVASASAGAAGEGVARAAWSLAGLRTGPSGRVEEVISPTSLFLPIITGANSWLLRSPPRHEKGALAWVIETSEP